MPKSFEASAQVECAGGESLDSQFDEGLWQQWPSPSTEISVWHTIVLLFTISIGWFPNLTRAYDNIGRCPRQKFVLGQTYHYIASENTILRCRCYSLFMLVGIQRQRTLYSLLPSSMTPNSYILPLLIRNLFSCSNITSNNNTSSHFSMHYLQCCHSKKIENPRRATEKSPENPRSNL